MKEIAVKYLLSAKSHTGLFDLTKESDSLEKIREYAKELQQNDSRLIITIFKRVTTEEQIKL
jgi:hypothetical protein